MFVVVVYGFAMDEIEPTPLQWAKDAWRTSPLEVLLPAAMGLILTQGLLAAFALRSHHYFLLALCFMALGFSIARSCAFFYRLSRSQAEETEVELTTQDLYELFLPLIGTVTLYGAIAPNFWLGTIFALISLPHFALLIYLAKRHARVEHTAHTYAFAQRTQFIANAVRGATTQFTIAISRTFRKTPDFTSH